MADASREELKACPFCGSEMHQHEHCFSHPRPARGDCLIRHYSFSDKDAWNTRTPIADVALDDVERLREALQPFAHAATSAGDEWVNDIRLKLDHKDLPEINLTLGDLRLARYALSTVTVSRQNTGASACADRAATPSEPSPAVSGIAGIPSAAVKLLAVFEEISGNFAGAWTLRNHGAVGAVFEEKLRALVPALEGIRDGRTVQLQAELGVKNEHLRSLIHRASTVMTMLEEHGGTVVPHLLDTDDNAGQFLREAIEAAREALGEAA